MGIVALRKSFVLLSAVVVLWYRIGALAMEMRWVRPRMHFLQLLDRHFGIDLRRRQLLMPEHHLNESDICAALEHQRRRRVPENMTAAPALVEPRGFQTPLCDPHDADLRQRTSALPDEDRFLVVPIQIERPRSLDVLRHPSERPLADRHHA